MKKSLLYISMVAGMLSCAAVSCSHSAAPANEVPADTIAVDTVVAPVELPELHADQHLNQATRFYAGMSCEGVSMTKADSTSWAKYSKEIKQLIQNSVKTRDGLDSIARTDFADFRDKVDYVFYPFSGADFLYAITLYPNADEYFFCGLEQTGTPFTDEINTRFSRYEAYRHALATFFRTSFFITKEMIKDFHNQELDGVCPVISMLMAVSDHNIISIKYKNLDEEGNLIDSESKSSILEFKFFREGSRHEQKLYYFSGNVENSCFDPKLKKYLDQTLPAHTVGSYLKAASFQMHGTNFSTIRDYILNHSLALVQDDSGIPYRFFGEKYDVTLYGKYRRPSSAFNPQDYQPDLEKLYDDKTANIRPLNFRIGYNNPSNLLCARRK